MSIGNDVKKKILNKSDLFNFYKDGYERYKLNYEKLLKSHRFDDDSRLNKRLNSQIQELIKNQMELETVINNINIELKNKDNEFLTLEDEINLKNSQLVNKKKTTDEFVVQLNDMKKNLNDKNDKINGLNVELDNKNIEINKLIETLSFKNNQINGLNVDLDDKTNQINQLNTNLMSKNNQLTKVNAELRKLKVPFHDFDEYLIESYVFPLVRPPFSDEAKRCFSVMENVASYLISKVENYEKHPLISVIMPVYNRKDVVMMAIDSVLNQTYDNFELIVVDDASTDGTTELLKTINHDKVKVIFHEKNKYASGARNTGLKHSNGEYIAYLDSDNILDERYLAATVGAFLELPDAGGIYSAQYRYETYDSKPFAIQFGSFNKSLLHNHNFVDMNCFAHRRDVYEDIGGFDETLKGADDWELILKISNNYKIYSIPFLLSKCYLGVVDNRVSDLVPTDMGKIRLQNEILPAKIGKLEKDISIIIPIYDSLDNIKDCIKSILSLKLNLNIFISSNVQNIDIKTHLKEFKFNNHVKLIESNGEGFTNALNQGIAVSDSSSDILILHQDAILTDGALEAMQKFAYELKDCGLVVSQQVLKNGSSIKDHVPYAHDDYWCDITPSKFYKNILKVPIFHDGEVLELKWAPFFCTYVKRDVLNQYLGFDSSLGKHLHSMRLFSEYVRHIMGLKIFHISKAIVIHNASEEYRNSKPLLEYDYNYSEGGKYNDYSWNF